MFLVLTLGDLPQGNGVLYQSAKGDSSYKMERKAGRAPMWGVEHAHRGEEADGGRVMIGQAVNSIALGAVPWCTHLHTPHPSEEPYW